MLLQFAYEFYFILFERRVFEDDALMFLHALSFKGDHYLVVTANNWGIFGS